MLACGTVAFAFCLLIHLVSPALVRGLRIESTTVFVKCEGLFTKIVYHGFVSTKTRGRPRLDPSIINEVIRRLNLDHKVKEIAYDTGVGVGKVYEIARGMDLARPGQDGPADNPEKEINNEDT